MLFDQYVSFVADFVFWGIIHFMSQVLLWIIHFESGAFVDNSLRVSAFVQDLLHGNQD